MQNNNALHPKYIHVLIPKTWDYVGIYGKEGFADVIKLRILKWDIIGYLGEPSEIIRLLKWKKEAKVSELVKEM